MVRAHDIYSDDLNVRKEVFDTICQEYSEASKAPIEWYRNLRVTMEPGGKFTLETRT
jgi:hypothetical protein